MGQSDDVKALGLMFNGILAELRLGRTRPFTFDHHVGSDGAVDHVELAAGTINVEEVHSFIAYCAAPATGATLVLGGRSIPIPVGLSAAGGLLIRLSPNDARQLVAIGGNCVLYLELMGEEIVGAPTLSMGRT